MIQLIEQLGALTVQLCGLNNTCSIVCYYIYIHLLLASSLYGVGVEEGGQVSGGEGGMTN